MSPVFSKDRQGEGLALLHTFMTCRKKTGADVAIPEKFGRIALTGIANPLKWTIMVLFVFNAVASSQPIQTIDERQLASMLCRNPADDKTNEWLDKNPQLVNLTLWNALLDCAFSTQSQRTPGKPIEIYKLALGVAERLQNPELIATSYYYLGRTYSAMSDLENSIQAYETSKKVFEQAGIESNLSYVLADLGRLYLTAEDYEKAQSYSEQSLTKAQQIKSDLRTGSLGPVEYGRARSLHTLGDLELRRGEHANALQKLKEALASYEQLSGASSSYKVQISEVLISLAKVYAERGQYGEAFQYLTKAHQVSSGSGDKNTRANIMSNQAALFLEQEDLPAAQKYFNASLVIYRSLGNTREEARVLLNLGVIEQRGGHYEDALQLFQRTMARADDAKLIDVQIAAGQGLSAVFTARRDFQKALNAINTSLELARRANAKTREAELLYQAAQTYFAMQDYRESEAVAEQALSLARSLSLPKLTYLATAALGEVYAAEERIEPAIVTLKEAVDRVEKMRDEVVGRQESRHLFFENKVGPYHTLIRLLTRQGKNFEALGYAERAKGRVLLETVRNNRSDFKDIYTESEKAEADSLINKLHGLNQRLQSQVGVREPEDELRNELNSVRGELARFQERLAAAHPDLLLRAGAARPLTQASLNSLLNAKDVAYLEFVVPKDHVGVFVLTRNALAGHDFKYISLPVTTDELRRKVDEFHSALAQRGPGYDLLGRELYRLLIEPVASELQGIRTVCIIPDEVLWRLPFQALIMTTGDYLIQGYSLYYAPSLSVLNEMSLHRRTRTGEESLIAFGNPVIEKGDKLKHALHPLPEAEDEVTAVANMGLSRTTKVLVGRQADEKTFKALAAQYATIHLATHGLLDNRDPLNSYLVLTKANDDAEDDGLLRAREIIDMHLDADLAVLSACETANGRISPGEGVVGMSWAFLVAGTRSVVVSQWRVNSASTAQFMKNFYETLAKEDDPSGPNKAQALREASLRLLKERRYRHPFYWAGFVLVSSN